MSIKTYSFDDGKYEVDRNTENGLILNMRRDGEHWPVGIDSFSYSKMFHAMLNRIDELEAPIDMVLHCPKCGMQHIDEADEICNECGGRAATCLALNSHRPMDTRGNSNWAWTNPPHRSHLCAGCNHIWRPADVATNGVQAVKSKGQNDSPIVVSSVEREQRSYDAGYSDGFGAGVASSERGQGSYTEGCQDGFAAGVASVEG